MSEPVSLSIANETALLQINNPPVNALSSTVRREIATHIETIASHGGVRTVGFMSEGRLFSAGADIGEFGKPPSAPSLPELCDLIENLEVPVFAALHGSVLGGGLELALGAHYRIAHQGTRLGFPEINLGILPGAGGTQRTPRICGAEASLDLMLSGKPIGAARAVEIGLIDGVFDGDVATAAEEYAQRLLDEGCRPRRSSERRDGLTDLENFADAVQQARDRLRQRKYTPTAAARIIECVEASVDKPFRSGLEFEREQFGICLASDESSALRHLFRAERACRKVPGIGAARPVELKTVGIVGAGLMGSGIAATCLNAGLAVILADRDQPSLASGLRSVSGMLDRAVERGLISRDQGEAQRSNLTGANGPGELGAADLVIEAVVEDLAVKTEVLSQLADIVRPDTVIASNTSYLDINELGAASGKPDKFIGLHFFAPAHVMKLVEVVPGDNSSPTSIAAGFELARLTGKFGVHAGACEGFIGNRILTACREAANLLLLDGATPYAVDASYRQFGFPMGMFEIQDFSGLDISWARRRRSAHLRNPDHRYCSLADRLCEAGRFGQKSGRGFYLYPDGKRGVEDLNVIRLLELSRAEAGGAAGLEFTASEIQSRLIAAMINEAARILEEGMALRPSDIDIVEVYGFGFPKRRGGPMHHADQIGIPELVNRLREYSTRDREFWMPADLLTRMASDRASFADINAGRYQVR